MSDLELSDDILFNDDEGLDEDDSLPSPSAQVSLVADDSNRDAELSSSATTQDSLTSSTQPRAIASTSTAEIPMKSRTWHVHKTPATDSVFAASAPVDIINPKRWRNSSELTEKEDNSPVPPNTFVPLHTMYRDNEKEEDILGTSYGEYRPRALLRRKMEFLQKLGLIQPEREVGVGQELVASTSASTVDQPAPNAQPFGAARAEPT